MGESAQLSDVSAGRWSPRDRIMMVSSSRRASCCARVKRERLGDRVLVLEEPTTLPWGNRAMMLADPDGNRVNLYAPYTQEAKARFAGR